MVIKLTDVRRLTGVNFLMDDTGAVAEAVLPDCRKDVAIKLWQTNMRAVLDGVGWQDQRVVVRGYPGGASTAISAPLDALYAATDLIEVAWQFTEATLNDTALADMDRALASLSGKIAAERSAPLVALAAAAARHDVTFLAHDGGVSVGLGTGCLTWPDGKTPDTADIDWSSVHDVPVALVTGTNGKSTTVRLIAAIGAEAKKVVGLSSSDWVRVGDEIIDVGDYSGPAGARMAVRDTRVELAVIEAARGGLMRRGLPVPRADACLITNVAADHLGDYGITDVPTLADAKFLVAKAVRPGGYLVLNADDLELVARAGSFDGNVFWYGLTLEGPTDNGPSAYVSDGVMTLARDGETIPILAVDDFAPSMKGAARFNVSNALGAIAVAAALDLPADALTRALRRFSNSAQENPGRGNFMEIGGVTILIDFAHNPHGVLALAEAIAALPAARRLIVIGQAGDRSDEDTRQLTRAVWAANPDMVVVKELTTKLRGRALGEVPAVIHNELRNLGADGSQIAVVRNEFDAVRHAIGWAQPGDLLVLLLHEDRGPPLAFLDRLMAQGWHAGDPLPEQAV